MQIFINKYEKLIEENTSLYLTLQQFNIYAESGIAVAVNNTVIPRANWQTYILNENDKVTVITATQGG